MGPSHRGHHPARELTVQAAKDSKRVIDGLARDGYTLEEIAEVLDVTFRRVKQIAHSEPAGPDDQEDKYIF